MDHLVDAPSATLDWIFGIDAACPQRGRRLVMIGTLMLGAPTLVRERERESWETLLATPVDALMRWLAKR